MSVAVAGTGAVGHAAVMAAYASGCTTIVAIDLHANRVATAQEVGATHGIHGKAEEATEELMRITGGRGVDRILDTTGSPASLGAMAGALAIRGTLGHVGAASPGRTATFEVGGSLLRGWSFTTIVQGSSVPQVFIPKLIDLWQQGRFPVEKLTKSYGFDDINTAFEDSTSGRVIKPVLVF